MIVLAQASENAIPALIVVAVGFVVGTLAAAATRRITSSSNRPDSVQASSSAIATLAFSLIVIAALVAALGMINEAALTKLLEDVVTFLPKALAALIVIIIGNIVAAILQTAAERSLGHVSQSLRDRVPVLIKMVVMGFAAVIAADQLGVDTTIVLVAVASIFFTIGLSVALLAGLGGRPVARQIAAGRALRRELSVGDSVKVGKAEGEISAIGSTSTQITSARTVTLVPNLELLNSHLEIVQAVAPIESVSED